MTRFKRQGAFSAARYIERHFPDAQESGDERIVPCLFCDKKKLYVNVAKGVWLCYRCGEKGTMFAFVRAHLGVGDAEAARVLSGFVEPAPAFDAARISKILSGARDGKPKAVSSQASLPEGYRPLPLDTVLGRSAWRYLAGRGVTPDQIATHRIGVSTRGKLSGCVILPVVQGGAPVYWVARKFQRSGNKYLNPLNGETPMSASEVLFNLDVAVLYGRVTLVEGYFDALGEGATGVAMLGKVLHPAQLALLRREALARPGLQVRVKLDEDVQLAHAMNVAMQLMHAGFESVVVDQTIGDPAQRLGVRGSAAYSFPALIGARVGQKT